LGALDPDEAKSWWSQGTEEKGTSRRRRACRRMPRERPLEDAIRVALEGADSFGTWDCDWQDYAGADARRVRGADDELVRRVRAEYARDVARQRSRRSRACLRQT
jgi:hypothetical protein